MEKFTSDLQRFHTERIDILVSGGVPPFTWLDCQPFTVKRRLKFPARSKLEGKMSIVFFGRDFSDPPAVSPKSRSATEARSLLKRPLQLGLGSSARSVHTPP